MSLRRSELRVSVAEYVEGEKNSSIRHEYVDGEIYAMAGASDRHNRIALNIASRLNEHLDEGRGEAFISDMKIKVDDKTYYYPDVMVSCDQPVADPYSRSQPVLIIEVTSPATTRIDHHEKMMAYRGIPSLIEYILIAQDQMRVEAFRKGQDWGEVLSRREDILTFDSTGLSMSLAEIYRNVK